MYSVDGAEKNREIKLCLVGESEVGKSSIAIRVAENKFNNNFRPTIGASFLTKETVCDEIQLRYNVWDTAGQERFRSLAPLYYRGANVVIIVYDITHVTSFDETNYWVQKVNENSPDDVVCVLAGNKCDLEDQRQVPERRGKEFADSIGALFFEISAKTSYNTEEMFQEISEKLVQSQKQSKYGTRRLGNNNKRNLFYRAKTFFAKKC